MSAPPTGPNQRPPTGPAPDVSEPVIPQSPVALDGEETDLMAAHAEREERQRIEARLQRIQESIRREEAAMAAEAAQEAAGAGESEDLPPEPEGGEDGTGDPEAAPVVIPGAPGPQGLQDPASREAARGTAGLANALVPFPSQVAGGALDAIREISAGISDFVEMIEGVSVAPGATRLPSPDQMDQLVEQWQDIVPEIGPREGGGGEFPRAMAQFVTGFLPAGKIAGLSKLAKMGRAGQIGSAAIRGAVADFSVFDPQEGRLADLIEQFPALSNPVTRYLQSDPNDSDAEGRFKNTLEGLGLGVATDAFVTAMRAFKAMRQAKRALRPAARAVPEVELVEESTKIQRSQFEELLGDPERPLFDVTPLDVPDEEAARALSEGAEAGPERAAGAVPRGTRGEAGSDVMVNWARINGPDDVKAVMQDMADAHAGSIDEARRGRVTWEQTRLNAQEEDAFEILMSRQVGDTLNDSQVVAVRELWGRSGRKLRELVARVEADPSDINQIAFRKMMHIHGMIQEQVFGARAEIARAHRAWAIPAGDSIEFSFQMDELKGLLNADVNTVDLASRVRQLYDMGRIDAADKFVHGTPLARTGDAIAQLWYGSILSGPHTQMRNIISTSATMPLRILERRVASMLSQTIGSGEIPGAEAAAMYPGLINGLRDAFRISRIGRMALRDAMEQPGFGGDILRENAEEFGGFWRAGATMQSGFGAGKIDERMMGSFDPEKWGKSRTDTVGSVLAMLDTTATLPMRGLTAGDEIFKTANHRMQIHALAVRKATKELETGVIDESQYLDRVATLLNEPDKFMRLSAQEFAQEGTFTLNPTRSSRAAQFLRATNKLPIVGRLAQPFVRITWNLARFSFRRSPIAPLMRSYRDAIAEGGARADLARAEMLTGSAFMLVAADLAMQGRITGEGPEDPAERAYLRRSGWQPNSAVVGGDPNWQIGDPEEDRPRYFSIRGLEPFGSLFLIPANTVEIAAAAGTDDNPELDEVIVASTLAIANQLTLGSHMYGAQNMIEALSDPKRYGEGFFQQLAGTAIPTGVASVTKAQDPIFREVNNMMDAVRARIPGLSKSMPARTDVFGRPITRDSGLGATYDAISPLYSSKWDPQPIDEEMKRMGAYLPSPNRVTSFDGVRIDLANYPGAYNEYKAIAGQEVTTDALGRPITAGFYTNARTGGTMLEELNALVSGNHPLSEIYDYSPTMTDQTREALIRNIVSAYRDAARDVLLDRYPEIRSEVNRKNQEDAAGAGPGALEIERSRQSIQELLP